MFPYAHTSSLTRCKYICTSMLQPCCSRSSTFVPEEIEHLYMPSLSNHDCSQHNKQQLQPRASLQQLNVQLLDMPHSPLSSSAIAFPLLLVPPGTPAAIAPRLAYRPTPLRAAVRTMAASSSNSLSFELVDIHNPNELNFILGHGG